MTDKRSVPVLKLVKKDSRAETPTQKKTRMFETRNLWYLVRMRSCKADKVLMVCAFFAISRRMRGMSKTNPDVRRVGNRD